MSSLPADFPAHIPEPVPTLILSELLRIHSQYLEKQAKLDIALRAAYDAYARALRDCGQELTDGLLNDSIPGWVFSWAVQKKWLQYPPIRSTGRSPAYFLDDPRPRQPAFEPVPERELTTIFGGYKITDWYKADVMNRLASRIAYWQAEALIQQSTEQVSIPSARTLGAQIKSLREECRWTIEDLASEVQINERTIQRHEANEVAPYARTIRSYERVFSKHLKRQVIIN